MTSRSALLLVWRLRGVTLRCRCAVRRIVVSCRPLCLSCRLLECVVTACRVVRCARAGFTEVRCLAAQRSGCSSAARGHQAQPKQETHTSKSGRRSRHGTANATTATHGNSKRQTKRLSNRQDDLDRNRVCTDRILLQIHAVASSDRPRCALTARCCRCGCVRRRGGRIRISQWQRHPQQHQRDST